MNERRRLSLRLALVVSLVVAAIWAVTALGGGSQASSGDSGAGNSPLAGLAEDDCPGRGSSTGDGSPDV